MAWVRSSGRPVVRWSARRVSVLLLLTALTVPAAEVWLPPAGDGVTQLIAAARFGGRVISVAPEEAALVERPLCVALTAIDPAGAQALATACDGWWLDDRDGALLLTHREVLPSGGLHLRSVSGLAPRAGSSERLKRLLAPWGGQDLRYDQRASAWTARLDDDGWRELVALVALFDQPRAVAPPLIRAEPDPTLGFDLPEAADWVAWAGAVCAATGRSTAVHPRVLATRAKPPANPLVRSLGEARAALASINLRLALVDGAWCLDTVPPVPRRHPALRRFLAVLPVSQLPGLGRQSTVEQVADRLRGAVAPAFAQPGWLLAPVPDADAVLVAADPPTIHQVIDRLAQEESAAR